MEKGRRQKQLKLIIEGLDLLFVCSDLSLSYEFWSYGPKASERFLAFHVTRVFSHSLVARGVIRNSTLSYDWSVVLRMRFHAQTWIRLGNFLNDY